MKYLTPLCLFLVLPAAMAQEMNRCQVGGEVVIQEAPCAAPVKKSAAQLRADIAAAKPGNERAKNLDQVLAQGRPLTIAVDPAATWLVLEITGASSEALHTITTKRVGSSGETWSKREYNCRYSTVRYLGTSDSLEKMRASKPDPAMTQIGARTIADYLGREACRNYDAVPFAAGGKGNP